MKFIRTLKVASFLGCVFLLCNQPIFAASLPEQCPLKAFYAENNYRGHDHFGTASLELPDPDFWYTIETESYPTMTALSKDRNRGFGEGGVYTSPTGFTIGEEGNYWVSFSAVLQNPTEESTVIIPVFLILNEEFDPENSNPIAGIGILKTDELITIQGMGFLRHVEPGSRISLAATNAGYPLPVPIKVISWSISVFKLP